MELSIPHTGGPIEVKLEFEDGVHPPAAGTVERLQSVQINGEETALDLGCGCGIYGLFAAKAGCIQVTLTDVCPDAVSAAAENAELNELSNTECLQGDFFDPVAGQSFDIIFANMPQTPAPEPMRPDKWGGPEGTRFLSRLGTESPGHLKPGGSLYFLHIGLSNPSAVMDLFSQSFELEVVHQIDRHFQPGEYESYQPGLFQYLMELREAGKAEFERAGNGWCFQTRFVRATKR